MSSLLDFKMLSGRMRIHVEEMIALKEIPKGSYALLREALLSENSSVGKPKNWPAWKIGRQDVLARDQAVSSVPSASRPATAPQNGASGAAAGFPRVGTGTQKARDSDRRRILDEELANEQKALDAARRELASQESIRTDERNYQKALERLQPYKDKLQIHERNIEALRKEIANLR